MDNAASPSRLPEEVATTLSRWIDEGRIELPAIPQVTAELLAATFEPDCDLTRVEAILERDPHIAGQVLRLANSSMFATTNQIKSLGRSVTQLGVNRVREVALRISCESRVFRVPGFEEDVARILLHSKTTAFLSRAIARVIGIDPEESFVIGLLHDVGRPVTLQALVDLVVILKAKTKQTYRLTENNTRLALTEHHARVAAALLKQWQLPSSMIQVIANHHQPNELEDEEMRRQAWGLRLADGFDEEGEEVVEEASAALGLSQDAVADLRDQLRDMRELAHSI